MCGSRLTGRKPSWQAWAISGRSKVGRGADVTRTGSSLIGVIGSIQIRLGIVPEGCRGICPGPIEMSFLATREWIMQPVDKLTVLRVAGMTGLAGEALCSAHHGLCLAVSGHRDSEAHTVLFDAGPDPYALERNGRHTRLDFGRIEALVLSHGHFDHSEGLLRAVELIRAANGGQPVPLHVHPGAFVKRGLRLPSGELLPFQDVPPRHALEAQGARVVVCAEEEKILDGLFYLSGERPRRSFERGFQTHYRQTADGQWEP